jgi:hypothetical protein
MSEGLEFIINTDGVATLYDDTYDITIHCESQEEQDDAIRRMKAWRWIPVTERLPEVDELVLVTDDSGGVKTVGVDRCGEYEASSKRFWYYTQNVTAWMPLPKPYKKEGD